MIRISYHTSNRCCDLPRDWHVLICSSQEELWSSRVIIHHCRRAEVLIEDGSSVSHCCHNPELLQGRRTMARSGSADLAKAMNGVYWLSISAATALKASTHVKAQWWTQKQFCAPGEAILTIVQSRCQLYRCKQERHDAREIYTLHLFTTGCYAIIRHKAFKDALRLFSASPQSCNQPPWLWRSLQVWGLGGWFISRRNMTRIRKWPLMPWRKF